MTRSTLAVQRRPPRVRLAPRAVESDADEAIDFAIGYGLTPFEWQCDVLRDWLGRRPDGTWSASTCGLAVPRQNGKNAVIEVREFYGAAILGERIVHTAHQVKTAREAFMRVAGFFDSEQHPEFRGLIAEVRKANGQEAIYLRNGGEIRFIARSGPSGRGMSFDTLILDEAQDATEEELAALKYMLATSPNAQTILTGTPPDPERYARGYGEAFGRIRARGESKQDARLAWTDYGIKDGPLPDLDNRELWLASNPSLAEGLIPLDNVESERGLSSDEAFARERLGWWGDPNDATGIVLPAVAWGDCLDSRSQVVGNVTFAVDVSPSRARAAIAVAGTRADSQWHIEVTSRQGVVDARQGVDWLLPRVRELAAAWPGAKVAVAGGSAAESLVPAIEAMGVRVEVVRGLGAACGFLFDAVSAREVRHIGQPELDAALRGAVRREVGDNSFVWWRRKSTVDISALYAVTLALWQAEQDKGQRLAPINNVW